MNNTVVPVLQADNICKSFSGQRILNRVSVGLNRGEIKTLIGPSGGGKSTLLQCLNCLVLPDEGSIQLDGQQVDLGDKKSLYQLRQQVGMIFQSFNLFPHLSVGRNIMLAPTLVKARDAKTAEAQARKLLERVGLAEKFDAMPDQLSGGQLQRVAIARALAMEPQVLLCDEITSALDPELVGEVLRVVESLALEGMTLMMVTHEMAFARKVSDRVIFMHQGRVHETGAPAELFGNPQTPELQQFLSSLHD